MKLFYEQEAKAWEEVLPLGNGSLGAMVWGTGCQEKLGLNHDSLWSGYDHDKNNKEAASYLDEVRDLILEGSYDKGQKLLEKQMLGEYTDGYLPLGNILIDFNNQEIITDYYRELSLEDATARIRYKADGHSFEREYFCSNPHQALLMNLTCSAPALEICLSFESELKVKQKPGLAGISIDGQCPEHVAPDYLKDVDAVLWGDRGVKFHCELEILKTDGRIEVNKNNKISISDATEICLAFIFEKSGNEKNILNTTYEKAGYQGLRKAHVKDYQKLYNRVDLYLGKQPDLPTDKRLERIRQGKSDESLYALYFQYGRYLMISCSRKCGFPANLQGIWNWQMQAPWSCNYTTNINLQMNYWPAHSCNLAECLEPYFEHLKTMAEKGKQTAKDHYNCRGFSVAHNSDRWGSSHPVGVPFGEKHGVDGCGLYAYFPLGGAWLCEELWKYYDYKKDEVFLRETAYPLLRDAVLFCVDWLIEYKGYYITCPSSSPENFFYIPDGEKTTASMIFACTMDMTIIRELFANFKKTCEILEIDDPVLKEAAEKEARLYPYQIGKYGQLQEWPFDFDEPEPGHRHVSHMYGLYPAELFEKDEELINACRVSLERRLMHGGGHTGWSCGWIAILYAILEDGERVHEFLNTLLTRSTYPNLWDAHPPFQIDGNFAGIEAIANALVQDRASGLKLLPALPKEWTEGYVKGLCIKNNRCVDISWENGKLKAYRIYENPCS